MQWLVKTKMELDSHVDTCVLDDHCLLVHDHNRPVNVFGYDPKVVSKHAHIVDATIEVFILLINQAIVLSPQVSGTCS